MGSSAGTCLVAVDGSEASVQALVWGFRYAADRDLGVEVLTVWPPHRSVLIHEVPGHFCAARWSARTAQEDAIRQALDAVPEGPIRAVRLENAETADAIVRASAGSDLVVLGSDPNDRTHGLTDRIIEQAPCEVVVVGASGEVVPGRARVVSRQRLRKNLTA
jgi:nucleotide-binding universal stress UspA family protein